MRKYGVIGAALALLIAVSAHADMADGPATVGRVVSVNGLSGQVSVGFAPPGGRLTTSQGVCVLTTDVSAATVIYYAPCLNPTVPIFNGTNVQAYNFTSSVTDTTGLTLTLGSNWAATTLYDVFVTLSSGAPALCTVAWSASTAGASTRATSIQTFSGLPTNAAAATCRVSNTATISVLANQGTYIGTFITNASTGQIDFLFGSAAAGGSAAFASIWNQFNQVTANFIVTDTNTGFHVNSTSTFEPYDAVGTGSGNSNRVKFITGNGSGPIHVTMNGTHQAAVSAGGDVTVGLNVTNAVWVRCATATDGISSGNHSLLATCAGYAPAGFNFVQALEFDTSGSSTFFGGSSPSVEGLSAIWSW